MPITLNKKKDFKKTEEPISQTTLKAQDETIQITRKEWEAMQESLTQLQNFMNDLVEGNLEIEIVDDEKEAEEPKEEKEVEEVAVEAKQSEEDTDAEKSKEVPVEDDEKAEDADLEEVMKDPEKRKAVLEYLKATDAVTPIKDLSMSKVRKRVNTLVAKEKFDVARKGKVKMTPNDVVNEIMDLIKKEKQAGKPIGVENLGKIANKVLNALDTTKQKETAKAEDKSALKRKTIKKSIDSAIPDFTSRFDDKPRVKKAVDNKTKKDLSQEFSNRFN